MSDQDSGFPQAPPPGSAPESEWEPVKPPAGEGYPPPPPGYAASPPNYPPPPPGYMPPQGQYPPPGYGPPITPSLSSFGAAALCYVTFIPAVIFLVIEPYRRDAFVKFHAWQCIVLTAVLVVGNALFMFLGKIGHFMDFLLYVILFVFWLIAIINASKGVRYRIPVVADVAENLAQSV